ncbi:beta-ketoacyl-[acyl-carrier-protein] synthase family protein [Legionella pneumophila serogroup 1]|uniref:beta-ketoacyl-[acyl-carrier-protein] synthase family protein n=1 Tax=Legionella pneumophila TaxID=446 RepID=UPI0007708D07|nr:beta-ketoacyl-[acyl-carrier-protein] synthase family protein [Legionella pneumophila]HAT8822018.1 beta-ketoacyl-ACP synthase II [Legionella pneumophila subsp. pneumophila]MCH9060986.1 beta-ketoacyl-[acyl-carrier-protein] synthase family protein [Legionella pneumophila serogroup 1]MCH9064038.1 beta-ketoacyl-[acyl-carrier-protein] synthase family protein [Legionella pneumophila serogroup 1]MCH9066888.1 beta-ketoacyl-[acyl-carrier-protein] synthase family protein [Legionella pneumophila serogro
MKRRVAITGLGVVSPLGNDVSTTWNNLIAGHSGIDSIKQFDASAFPTTIAAEVKNFSPDTSISGKHIRFIMSFTHFALEAARQAFEDASIFPTKQTSDRWGIVTGSGMMTAEFEYLTRFQQTCAAGGEIDWGKLQSNSRDFYNLVDFGKTTSNSGLSLLIQQYGITGYASSVHTACASGGQALGLAMQVIRRGEADFMLAGGFDSMINPLGLSSFCLLGALSTYNETPQTASRPFDATRNGFVLGEGAAFLILEEWSKAKARGAKIYAELAGEGNSLSSYRITDSHPNGDGAIQAIKRALEDAGVQPRDVDYINAHGTSTKMNDLSETNAIKVVFGDRIANLPVSSTKSQTGHLIAAAGALEAVLSVKSIEQAQVPKTANLKTPDPECDLDYVVDGPREKSLGVVLSNSFGFGGSNSCLLFKHPEFEEAK